MYGGKGALIDNVALAVGRGVLITAICQVCLYYFDLYDLSQRSSVFDVTTRAAQALGCACIVLAGIYYFLPQVMVETRVVLAGYVVVGVSIGGWRFFYALALDRRMFTQAILLLGTGELANAIAVEVQSRLDSGYKIALCVDVGMSQGSIPGIDLLRDVPDLLMVVRKQRVDKIVVALDDRRGAMPVRQLLDCRVAGTPVVKGIDFYEELTGKIMVEKTNPGWLVFSQGFRKSRLQRLIKRMVDVIFSLAGLLLSLPVTILAAVIVKLESSGPVFYRQERVGEKGRKFKVIKFRSMHQDAEANGPVWARQNDDRATRFGKFMRKVRIDEIPQMWNVFKGDMSFVGPRPERQVFVEGLEKKIPYYALRHSVKPGITGWAQICYPYGASEEDALRKLEYDLYYIKNMSVWMDLMIILQTVKTVLFQKGAR